MIHLSRQNPRLRSVVDDVPTVQGVCAALQQAVELEHSTIPLYLYAAYSLDASKNRPVIDIIESVVIEEMLHMTLASNVLNALGGAPNIDQPGFIPTYPGPLPGGVDSELIVNLAPFSSEQLQTFLQIEEPEDPLVLQALVGGDEAVTIGQFYTAIARSIVALGDGAFVDPPRNQVGPDLMDEAIVVTDVASACAAIQRIIVQGEGTTTSPEDADGEPAHYYRFMQIQRGHLLVPAAGQTPPWAYTGPAITFDASGVYAIPTNPGVSGYPAGSAAAFANDNFNYTYTALLGSLHALFNGVNNQGQLNRAIGLMMSLKGQAKAMTSGIPNPNVLAGPSFQYQASNPPGR
jgi:Ferritin-like